MAKAASTGKLRVWGVKAHGPGKPDKDGTHELLDPWVFEGSREVNEAGWLDWRLDSRRHLDDIGPWYDELRFDAAEVQAIWPAPPPAAPGVLPFPEAPHWLAWNAVAWRAFGTLDIPTRIARHRSFDGGTSQLPDESGAAYAARQDEYRRIDDAERELMDLLASGLLTAKGRPRASKDGRQLQHAAAPTPEVMPAITFLNRELAFTPSGDLMPSRLPLFKREFDNRELHGSDADPRFPLYYDVLVETAGLRKAWSLQENATASAPAPEVPVPSPPIYNTGTAGRPSSKHLALAEMRRRAGAGTLATGIKAESEALSAWLTQEHPQAPPATAKSLENSLRDEFKALRLPPK